MSRQAQVKLHLCAFLYELCHRKPVLVRWHLAGIVRAIRGA
jgi:hypothetical protein